LMSKIKNLALTPQLFNMTPSKPINNEKMAKFYLEVLEKKYFFNFF